MNGKGYNNNRDIEFELNNGNGSGKEYNYLGNFLFEGEFQNGKRWNGKMFNNKGDIEFELNNGNVLVDSIFKAEVATTIELLVVKSKLFVSSTGSTDWKVSAL